MATESVTVCIVDDDQQVLTAVSALLTAADFDVKTFSSAEAFLEFSAREDITDVDCLVLDVRLPGMNGTELQQRLTAEGIWIPTVLISGHATEEIIALGLANGASALLEKPFAGRRLLQEIEKASAAAESD